MIMDFYSYISYLWTIMVKRFSAKEPSQRQQRVGEFIREILSTLILRGELQNVSPLDVSIMSVSVSPDLRYATVYVTPRPSGTGKKAKTADKILNGLNNAKKFLRVTLSKEMTSRVCPELVFEQDESFEHLSKMTNILHDIATDSPENEPVTFV